MIDKNSRSMIRNLCPWAVSFRLPISKADVLLSANKTTSINNEELIVLCENGNVMFSGTGEGNHARIYMENADLRKYVGYDSEDGKTKQFILNDEECQKLLDYKTMSAFEKNLEEKVVGQHEKARLIDYARKVKFNDFDKIVALEQHCEIKYRPE